MSSDEEIKYYDWAFANNLETRKSYLRKKNPDLQDSEIEGIVEQIDAESPESPEGTLIDQIINAQE